LAERARADRPQLELVDVGGGDVVGHTGGFGVDHRLMPLAPAWAAGSSAGIRGVQQVDRYCPV
jgi:hypothetical protein